jgi:asparagine synthetase B (glutamine-hydrolysing)
MCGIAGFIGKATNPKVSFQLLQSLLLKTEHRGPEATGFWGAQSGEDGKLIYHKEPIKASEFVKRPMVGMSK